MVNISSSRRRGTSAQTRYRIRRIILLAIIVIIIFYIFSLRLYLKKQQQQHTKDNKHSYGPPQREENDDDNNNKPVAVIAHAISLIKCSKGSSVTGFLDAAAILRHSIHKNSIHYKPPILIGNNNNNSTTTSVTTPKHQQRRRRSKYSYKMYGIVHTSCADHAQVLERLGYEIMVRDHPIKKDDIKGEWLRNHIEAENCCGSAEFIKLYGMFLHLIFIICASFFVYILVIYLWHTN